MNARTQPSRRGQRQLVNLPVPVAATSLVQALAAAAADPRTDMDKMERLFAMHQAMLRRQAEVAFNDAMAKAQAEIQPVINNATNTHTRSGYAKLAAIDREITPIHTKYGLSISYDTETKNDADPIPEGMLRTVAIVSHSEGHSRRHHIDLPPDVAGAQGTTNKTMVQARGSTNAYARRYLKLMIFNVSTLDDNDGNGGRANDEPTEQRQETRGAPRARPASSVPQDQTPATPGQVNIVKARLESACLSTADLSKKFGFDLETMPKARVNEVLDWTRNPAPA